MVELSTPSIPRFPGAGGRAARRYTLGPSAHRHPPTFRAPHMCGFESSSNSVHIQGSGFIRPAAHPKVKADSFDFRLVPKAQLWPKVGAGWARSVCQHSSTRNRCIHGNADGLSTRHEEEASGPRYCYRRHRGGHIGDFSMARYYLVIWARTRPHVYMMFMPRNICSTTGFLSL